MSTVVGKLHHCFNELIILSQESESRGSTHTSDQVLLEPTKRHGSNNEALGCHTHVDQVNGHLRISPVLQFV